jgi:hypothetical protein
MSAALDGIHYTNNILNWTFFVDDIDGRRIGITTNFNATGSATGGDINPAIQYQSGTPVPDNYTTATENLVVDDTVVQSSSCTINYQGSCIGGGVAGQLTLTATHPYAAGAFANETIVKQLTSVAMPVAIVSGWGMISPARLSKWSDEVAQDLVLPKYGTLPYPCPNGEVCMNPYQTSEGDFTRQKLAASWLAEMTRMLEIQAKLGGEMAEHHHSIGIVDWRATLQAQEYPAPGAGHQTPDYLGIYDEFTDLNIDSVVSLTSLTDNLAKTAAVSRAVAASAAALEGSVLEQMQDLPDTASTASRFAWGNNPGADNQTGDL